MQKVLIIIPAYNEEASIGNVIASVQKELPSVDILVVNDGSIDSTSKIAKTYKVKVLDHPFNLGIGAAMQSGFRYAMFGDYDIAVQVDGDGQHPADQIKYVIEPVKSGEADVSIGSRFYGKDYTHKLGRWIGMKFFSQIISLILQEKISDTTSGFRAVNREVIKFYSKNYPEDYPEVEAIVLLHKAGFTIKEVSVKLDKRNGGVSSITGSKGFYYMVKVFLAVFVDLLKKIER